jgi:hypothetical protein
MKNENYPVADLSQEELRKVKKAEQAINHGTDTSKVLIAYDKEE